MAFNTRQALAAILLTIGFVQIGDGLYIKLKANVAYWLIEYSWHQRDEELSPKPWPWADTSVVARLEIPRLNISQYIMRDMSGESLAFGPGALEALGANSNNLLAGHRDTHFQYLDELIDGDIIKIETIRGNEIQYRVNGRRIIDSRNGPLNLDMNQPALSMITCWPMDSVVPGGPMRFIVSAVLVDESEV